MEELNTVIPRAAGGDPDAFEIIVRRFQDMAVGYAFSILGDFHLAQDASQEAFVQAYRDLPSLREYGAFPSWFRRLIFKHCDRLTRGKRLQTVPLEEAYNISSMEPNPSEAAEIGEMNILVSRAVQGLPEHERRVTTLFYISDYSQKEIAAFLDIPVSTVKKRLHDARKRLKERMFDMVKENLSGERPSQDRGFTEKVMGIIKPRELEIEGITHSWSCRGSDIWEMINAAIKGDEDQIRNLLKRDANLVRAEYFYTQPIHFAVREGHLEAVKVLLEAGADPTHVRYEGEELTTVARDRGHEEVAKLIEKARKEKLGDLSENHPIHKAVSSGDPKEVQNLIDADGSVVKQRDPQGRTPLHLAVTSGRLELVALLLDHGADVDAVQASGGSYSAEQFRPIDLAIWGSSFWMPRDNWLMVGYLLARGAAYTITIAAACGDLHRVKVLLDGNPELANDAQPCGKRPLSSAVEYGHTEIVKLLLENSADPCLPEGHYAPKGAALHAAARLNDLEVAEMLLEKGADPNSYIDSWGSTIGVAKDKEMRKLLYRYGGKLDAFEYVWEGNFDAIAAMADADPEETARSGCGGAFAAVVKKGDWDMLYMLLKRGVRVPELVTWCRTYLWKNPEMARVLLEHGMDPNLPNWQHVTPLHNVCSLDGRGRADGNRIAMADLFLEFGADINAKDEEYRSTPLGWAARCGLKDMVEHLLKHGAKTSLPDDEEWATPFAWAQKRGHSEIVEILRQHGD